MKCTADCHSAYLKYESSLQRNHRKRTEKKKRASKNKTCNMCERTFRFRRQKEWHEQNHHLMIHFCPKGDCRKAFQGTRGLGQHLAKAHSACTPQVSSDTATPAHIEEKEPASSDPFSFSVGDESPPAPLFTIANVSTLQKQAHARLDSEDETVILPS